MPTDGFELATTLPASPEDLYDAWLDPGQHARMTGGGAASVSPEPGARFTAWDGYIEGTNLELEPGRRIVQAWRTTQFPEGAPDSRLELTFEPAEGGTRLVLVHGNLPPEQVSSYEEGWNLYYFTPMRAYFAGAGDAVAPAAEAAPAEVESIAAPPTRRAKKTSKKTSTRKAPVKRAAKKPAAKKRTAKKPTAKKPTSKKKAATKPGAKKTQARTTAARKASKKRATKR